MIKIGQTRVENRIYKKYIVLHWNGIISQHFFWDNNMFSFYGYFLFCFLMGSGRILNHLSQSIFTICVLVGS